LNSKDEHVCGGGWKVFPFLLFRPAKQVTFINAREGKTVALCALFLFELLSSH
jgi:hypothetical protein